MVALLVAVFTGVAWDEGGGGSKDLWFDLAVGVGSTAVICASWWLAKRFVVASKKAIRQGYQGALALEDDQARRLGRWLGEAQRRASRPEYREAVVRDAARRAGRFVGSTRRAFRDASGRGGAPKAP